METTPIMDAMWWLCLVFGLLWLVQVRGQIKGE